MKTFLKEDVQEILNRIDKCLPDGWIDYKIVVNYKNGHRKSFSKQQELYDYLLLKKISDIEIYIHGASQNAYEARGCRCYGLSGFERGIYKRGV